MDMIFETGEYKYYTCGRHIVKVSKDTNLSDHEILQLASEYMKKYMIPSYNVVLEVCDTGISTTYRDLYEIATFNFKEKEAPTFLKNVGIWFAGESYTYCIDKSFTPTLEEWDLIYKYSRRMSEMWSLQVG